MAYTYPSLDAAFDAQVLRIKRALTAVRDDLPEHLPASLAPTKVVVVRPETLPQTKRVISDVQLVEMAGYRQQGMSLVALARRYHVSIEFTRKAVGHLPPPLTMWSGERYWGLKRKRGSHVAA